MMLAFKAMRDRKPWSLGAVELDGAKSFGGMHMLEVSGINDIFDHHLRPSPYPRPYLRSVRKYRIALSGIESLAN
jgi:hypothetical protein